MFTYIDIIVVLLALVCVLLGFWRGFFRSLTRFCGFFVKIALSFWLCKPFAKLISKITKIDEHLFGKISNWASGMSVNFNVNLKTIPSDNLTNFVNDSISHCEIPKVLRGIVKSIIDVTPESIASAESITLSEVIGNTFMNFVMIAIAFLLIFILLTLTIFIIEKVEKHLLKSTIVVSKIDRSLGGLVGLAETLVIIFSTCLFLSVFRNASFLSGFFDKLNNSMLSGPLSRLMFKLIDKNIDFGALLTDWITKKN